MKAQYTIDFKKMDWSKVDREKAEFIYGEALGRLDSIHQNNDGITNKALGLLTLAVPLLTALIGFFAVRWGGLSAPFLAASVCAAAVLFATVVLLLLVLLPRGINPGQVEPAQYFMDNYYKNNMEDIFKGNIQSLQKMIGEDLALLTSRGNLFRIAILSFSAVPVASGIVAAVTAALLNVS
jgi:heme A synthase